jgi:hypothetical protein
MNRYSIKVFNFFQIISLEFGFLFGLRYIVELLLRHLLFMPLDDTWSLAWVIVPASSYCSTSPGIVLDEK